MTDDCHKRQPYVEWDGFDREPEVCPRDALGVFRGLKYALLPSLLLWWGIIEVVRAVLA